MVIAMFLLHHAVFNLGMREQTSACRKIVYQMRFSSHSDISLNATQQCLQDVEKREGDFFSMKIILERDLRA